MVQTYGGRDGSGRNIIEGPNQPALADSRGNLLEGGGRRGGGGQARLLSRRLHSAPNFGKIFAGAIIHYTHSGEEKFVRTKIKTIWKIK